VGWLKYGLEPRRHERKGWLKDALQSRSLIGTADKDVWVRVLSDYKSQLAHVEEMEEFVPCPRIKVRLHVEGIYNRAHVTFYSSK